MIEKKYIPSNWSVLYVSLLNDWLSLEDVISILNDRFEDIGCDEETLVDINVNESNRQYVLEILKTKSKLSEEEALKQLQLASLLSIRESSIPLNEKLEEISATWSRFNYPEDWRPFIHYMPNEHASSEEEVYKLFTDYITENTVWD